MATSSLGKKATLVRKALQSVAPKLLAADSQIDFDAILAGVKRKNWLDKKPGIIAAIKPHLAKDADIKDVVALLDKLDSDKSDDDDVAQDDPKCAAIMDHLRGKISDEDLAQVEAMMKAKPEGQATDEPPQIAGAANANPKDDANKEKVPNANDDKEDMMDKKAMDKAIKIACDAAAKDAEQKTIDRMRAIADAEKTVKPYVGELTAMDSAEAVFKAALKLMNVDVKDVHPSAYRAVLVAQPVPGEKRKTTVAQDSGLSGDVSKAFPDLLRLVS